MSLHSYQVKVCLEDCETTVVTLMSPVILDHIQITWFFQYINDKWFAQMEEETFQPSIDMLCDQLTKRFRDFHLPHTITTPNGAITNQEFPVFHLLLRTHNTAF